MKDKSYLICDLETETNNPFKRLAHFRHNNIVAIGLMNSEGEKMLKYLHPEILKDLEVDEDILVGHNLGKFDVLYLWNMQGFQEFIKRGGKVFDTSLAEYMLSGQELKFPGLREIAVEKYGCIAREKVMENFWDEGIDTNDIPVELVMHDLDGDVEDTLKVYLGQLQQLTPKQLKLLEIQNDLQLATTEMEVNGIFVNKQMLINNMKVLEEKLCKIEYNMLELIKPYWKAAGYNDTK